MAATTPLDRVYRSLVVSDTFLAATSWVLGWALRHSLDGLMGRMVNPLRNHLVLLPILVPLLLAANASRGLYRRPPALGRLREFQQILQAATLGLVAAMTLSFAFKELDIARAVVFFAAGFNLLFLTAERNIVRRWAGARARAGKPLVRTVLLGDGPAAKRIAERLLSAEDCGQRLIGLVGPREKGTMPADLPWLGETQELPGILEIHGVHEVFVALPELPHQELLDLVARCKGREITFKVAADLFEVVARQGSIDETAGIPIIELGPGVLSPGESLAKRALDLALALVLGVVSLPLAAAVMVLIKLNSRGPIVFTHTRVGKDGEYFTMLKFRTMYQDTPPSERAPRDDRDPRITRIGRWLRRTSLDELPQLVNVLKGDMSFVGPRPEMPFIVEKYQKWQMQRLSVKPGITGLWQIMGRKDLPLEDNLEYDFYYIRNQSVLLDITILMKTVPTVLLGKGAY